MIDKPQITIVETCRCTSHRWMRRAIVLKTRRTAVRLYILSSLFVCVMFFSCSHPDTLIGKWTVEKVNFDFDERRNTPEMIQQFGEQEIHNTLIFKNDSIVNIVMANMDGDYVYHQNDNEIFVEDLIIGTLENGKITSKIKTPIGEMTVVYKK